MLCFSTENVDPPLAPAVVVGRAVTHRDIPLYLRQPTTPQDRIFGAVDEVADLAQQAGKVQPRQFFCNSSPLPQCFDH
jgi:hypothetical protein